jgi:hypothetical protein
MLDASAMVDLVLDRDDEVRGHELDHQQSRVRVGTWPAVSLHRRNAAEGGIGMTKICTTSSVAEMHVIGFTTGTRSVSTLSKNDVMRGTMSIMVPSTTNVTNSAPLKEGATQEESKLSPTI